jgi:carboxymethylenebutenolidase
MGAFTEVDGPDGSFEGYLALPAEGTGPSIMVLGEIYNVNDWVRAVTDRYAEAGFVAFAPDVYWRNAPRIYLDYNPEDQKRGRKLAAELDIGLAIKDLETCMAFLRNHERSNRKVGIVGFCLGGQLAYRFAAQSSPDAISVYYGTKLQDLVEMVRQISCPTQLHFGETDHSVPGSAAHDIARVAADMPNIAVHIYEGVGHAFNRFGYPPFDARAAELAEQRTIALFNSLLR